MRGYFLQISDRILFVREFYGAGIVKVKNWDVCVRIDKSSRLERVPGYMSEWLINDDRDECISKVVD